MTHMTEVNFGDFQMEERYKKLERTLKLASLRKENRKKDEFTLRAPSSINIDSFDSSINVPQGSRIDSEIVSSSNNLRNILLKRKNINSDHKKFATSSVRKFNEENSCQRDYLQMPPPSFDINFYNSKHSNNIETYNVSKFLLQNKYNTSDIDIISPKKENYKFSDNNEKYIDTSSYIHSNSFQYRNIKMFTEWTVILNEQNLLIIKGKIECGIIAWSKPIIRRLTSTKLECVCKHLYHLQGNIVDNQCELPNYVRGKFYDGFPDDWENVYEIWKMFVQQGCSATFRWPTPITDSDDDIKSEITDITFAYSTSPKNKISPKECLSEQKIKNKENSYSYNKKIDSFTQTHISDVTENLCYNRENIQFLINQYNNNKENYKQKGNMNLNYCHIKNKKNVNDILNVIVNNLTDKNCSQEYINKIFEILDCLNYVVSYKSIQDRPNVEHTKLKQDIQIEEKNSEINYNSSEYNQSEIIKNYNNSLSRKRTFTEMNNTSVSDSESAIYTGIPKIPIERIIRQKKTLLKSKRKIRKKEILQNHNTQDKQCISNISLTIPDYCTNINCTNVRSEKIDCTNFNDSSINITEDERNYLKVNDICPNFQDNTDKYVEPKIIKENEQNVHIHKYFAQKDTTDIHKSIKNLQDSYEKIKKNECKTIMTETPKNIIETNSCIETNNKNNQNRFSHQQQKEFSSYSKNSINERTKPVVLSSIPIDIEIKNKQLYTLQNSKESLVEDENKVIEELHEIKKRTYQKSPIKFNTTSRKNSNLLSDSEHFKENIKIQPNNMDSIITKRSSYDNSKISKDNKLTDDIEPKLLSDWTPRVLFKSGLNLIFEGNLLNEIGHIVHRKFKTDKIYRRISGKLVETIHHEFYQLVGNLRDTKHVIPKKLLRKCRYGCPVNIEQFCKEWESLQNYIVDYEDSTKKCNDLSMDNINVGRSSKGRRIIPPLTYWTGERIIMKDNNPVYKPGTIQDNNNRINNSLEQISKNSPKMLMGNTENIVKKIKNNKSKKFATKNTKKTRMSESSDSSNDHNISVYKDEIGKITSNSINISNKQNSKPINIENSHESCTNVTKTKTAVKKSKVRKNVELNTSFLGTSKQMHGSHQSSVERYRDIVCMYYQSIPNKDDILSDDQVSHV
ncbi:metacaspase-2 isoform X2 [Apis cerana]|uniref:metacaspase-2 isoform X2 n=1 Tax=Apis cerana TaxID=7461 RepID=UPI0007E2B2A0|nr:metacaspase-2 isoform X2 [Apis cerana]